jgi:hypothetical protein
MGAVSGFFKSEDFKEPGGAALDRLGDPATFSDGRRFQAL